MKAEIKQDFKGIINGVTITNQQVFQTTEYVLDQLEQRKGIDITDVSFTQDFVENLERMNEKSKELFDFNAFEQETDNTISSDYGLDDFAIYNGHGDDYYTHKFNKDLAEGKYNYLQMDNQAMADIYKQTYELTKHWSDEHKKDLSSHVGIQIGTYDTPARINALTTLIKETSEQEFNQLLGVHNELPNRESGATLDDMLLAKDMLNDGWHADAAIHKITSLPREDWQALWQEKQANLHQIDLDASLSQDEVMRTKDVRPLHIESMHLAENSGQIAYQILENYKISDELDVITEEHPHFEEQLQSFRKDNRLLDYKNQAETVMAIFDKELQNELPLPKEKEDLIKSLDEATRKDVEFVMKHPDKSADKADLVLYRMEKRLETQITKEPLANEIKTEKPTINIVQSKSNGNER